MWRIREAQDEDIMNLIGGLREPSNLLPEHWLVKSPLSLPSGFGGDLVRKQENQLEASLLTGTKCGS